MINRRVFWDQKPSDRLSNNLKFISVSFSKPDKCIMTVHDNTQTIHLSGRYDDDLLIDDPFCHGGIHAARGNGIEKY